MSTEDFHTPAESQALLEKAPEVELGELLEQVAQQNQFAFRELYQRTAGQLFAVQLRILKMHPIAEDALQETYVKIWNNAASYRADLGKPLTWMMSVARNQALDILRKRQTRENLESELIPDLDFLYRAESDSGDAELLGLCLDRLDENSRLCILRAYCEGYTHDELATQTGSPLGTVKSWIRRGLKALRECVNELS